MMKRIAEGATRIFLACGSTDFRKQIPGLVASVTLGFKLDPYNGDYVFIFCNRKRDSIKVLRYDQNGFLLATKKLLDDIRLLCRGKAQPIKEVYERFNKETDDGKNMSEMSELLSEAIDSIIDVKEESDIDSLFSVGGTSALMGQVSGLDDFELICFLVVK